MLGTLTDRTDYSRSLAWNRKNAYPFLGRLKKLLLLISPLQPKSSKVEPEGNFPHKICFTSQLMRRNKLGNVLVTHPVDTLDVSIHRRHFFTERPNVHVDGTISSLRRAISPNFLHDVLAGNHHAKASGEET